MWNKIGGVIGIVTILALVVAVVQLVQSNNAAKAQDSAQATQIALSELQLNVYRDIATLQASTPNSESAASVATRVAELEGTAIALATIQSVAKAVVSPTLDPTYALYPTQMPYPTQIPYPTPIPPIAVTHIVIIITPTSIPPTHTPQITNFMTVFANQAWQDTGITVNAGDTLKINYVSGSWRWTGDRPDYDGNGDPSANGTYLDICTTNYDCPITDAPLDALIGKIGTSGTPFIIGNGITFTVPHDAGSNQRLFLVGNDSFSGLHDNVGSIEVSIAK